MTPKVPNYSGRPQLRSIDPPPSQSAPAVKQPAPSGRVDIEAMHRQAAAHFANLQQEIARLEAELTRARLNQQLAQVEANRLASLLDELRAITANRPGEHGIVTEARSGLEPSQRPQRSRRALRISLAGVAVVIAVATGLFALQQYDKATFNKLASRGLMGKITSMSVS